jgi:uncharacterized GH25 family protein
MMPDKFSCSPGDSVNITFVVGENLNGESWNLRKDRIQKMELHHAGKVTDLSGSVIEGKHIHLKLALKEEGTYVLKMQSNNAFIELSADRFNQYLKENFLDEIIDRRKKTNATDKPGKEFYSRNTKLILQVGEKPDKEFEKNTGLPVEIIPLTNVADYKIGDAVKFRILYGGKPLFGARAYVWNNKDSRTYSQPIYTQQDGTIETRIFNSGLWMVSVVKMIPSPEQGADWQSYWGTFVFEIKEE